MRKGGLWLACLDVQTRPRVRRKNLLTGTPVPHFVILLPTTCARSLALPSHSPLRAHFRVATNLTGRQFVLFTLE